MLVFIIASYPDSSWLFSFYWTQETGEKMFTYMIRSYDNVVYEILAVPSYDILDTSSITNVTYNSIKKMFLSCLCKLI